MSVSAHDIPRSPRLCDATLRAGFLEQRQRINREVTLPIEYDQLATTHRLDIIKGDWTPESGYKPHIFWDSDVAKWLEAAAYSLQTEPDPDLESRCDQVIDDLAALQGEDGYLNSFFSQVEPESRWTNLRDRHELYCAGHLIEAAVAYADATGKRTLIEVMSRYADYIGTVFGTDSAKKQGYPGHEEIELALIKLYRATGNRDYLALANYFVDQRGVQPHYFDEEAIARGDDPASYRWGSYEEIQAHLPVREQRTAEGHSVRAGYLYSAMADLALETGDDGLAEACRTLWNNITRRRMYVHGGIGSSFHGERFTIDYELPNEEAYAETCAAISLVFFAQRMFALDADAEYIDVLERSLFNGVLSGVSADGKRFFYDNYLTSYPGYHRFHGRKSPDRQEWFGCACCPPNLARLLAGLGAYLFATGDSGVWINLYGAWEGRTTIGGAATTLTVATDYPWNGHIEIAVDPETETSGAVRLRIPGWCGSFSITVNDEKHEPEIDRGYAVLERTWRPGDRIVLDLEMPVVRISAHPSVRHDAGKIAIQRGPLVYCLEQADNGNELANLAVPADALLEPVFEPDLLGGVVTISGRGYAKDTDGWDDRLYRADVAVSKVERRFKAIPYFAWDNRGVGEMTIWIREA